MPDINDGGMVNPNQSPIERAEIVDSADEATIESSLSALNDKIVTVLKDDIRECEDYQNAVIVPTMKERYEIYFADKEYYKRMFPILSKTSQVISTDVTDTIEWALPSLMKVFTGGEDIINITPVGAEDSHNAEVMQDLIDFQLTRQNHFFPILYNWMKDALITGMGIVKCYWDRKEASKPITCILNAQALDALKQTGVDIESVDGPDEFGDYTVVYDSTYYLKNAPKIENILCSDFLYSPYAKTIDDANFVAHKKRVTMSYLREMQKQGIYANVDKVKPDHIHDRNGFDEASTEMEEILGDQYYGWNSDSEEARDECTLYECYVKIDVNGDGILEDMIITLVDDVVLRCEPNYMGRHPFFTISPTQDPHRIWAKRSYAELIGEIQHMKIAIMRQLLHNLALSNDPKMILSPDAINIDDFNKGRAVIRKKPGYNMNDVAMPMPVTNIAPYTFDFLEYIEGQKEARTGITRYNQGLDASSLNKTAHGINAIMEASNQRLELIARMFAETGIYELFRFLISLNQKFIDQNTVIRLSGEPLEIHPDDLTGSFDLEVNSGMSIQSRDALSQNLQTILTAIMQTNQAGVAIATPHNVYMLFKKWMETNGIKNTGDYITDPVVMQQRAMLEAQIIQMTLQTMSPDVVNYYMQYGSLPLEILYSLPPYIQVVFLGHQLPAMMNNTGGPVSQTTNIPPTDGNDLQPLSPMQGAGGGITGINNGGSAAQSDSSKIGAQPSDNRISGASNQPSEQGMGGF